MMPAAEYGKSLSEWLPVSPLQITGVRGDDELGKKNDPSVIPSRLCNARRAIPSSAKSANTVEPLPDIATPSAPRP